jgi:hypothetical protein
LNYTATLVKQIKDTAMETLSSKRQAAIITKYIDDQNVKAFSNLPNVESLRSALAKRCFALINANRGAKVETVNVKNDPQRMAQVMFALNTLWAIGYEQKIVKVAKHDIIWRRIRRFNVAPMDIDQIAVERNRIMQSGETAEYAIMKCSQKLRTTQAYRVMYILAPIGSTLTDSFNPVIFISGNDWYLGNTSGCQWVEKCPETRNRTDKTFTVWDSPYPTYDRDGILIHKEQNPNH